MQMIAGAIIIHAGAVLVAAGFSGPPGQDDIPIVSGAIVGGIGLLMMAFGALPPARGNRES